MISKRGATTRNPTKEIGTSAKGSLIEASDATKERSAPPNVVSRQKSATASKESIPRFTVSAHFSTASLIALRRSSFDSVVAAADSVIAAPRAPACRSPRLRDSCLTESPSHSGARPGHGGGQG